MEVRKLCMYQAYDHTHTHRDAHARTQQQSNKYSASIFPNHACMTLIQKILLLFLNISLLESSTSDYIRSKMSESTL